MPRFKKKRMLSKQTMIMHTKNPGHVCEIEWKIDNVLKFPDETFTSKVNLGRGCRTHLNLLIKVSENEYYSDFYMGYERTDKQKTAIRVSFDLELVNSKGDVCMRKKASFSPKTAHKCQRVLKIKFADPEYFESATKLTEDELRESDDDVLKNLVSHGFVVWDKDSLHKLYSLPEDSITVKGSVKVFACCVPLKTKPINESSSEDISMEMAKSELSNHLRSAFVSVIESGQFTDITLWFQEESVRAHKFILSARSPKFKRLLEPNSEGNSVSEIVIKDIEMSDFLHFLQYLYSGIVGKVNWEALEKLYEAAIIFEVNSLLEQCKCKLIRNLKDRRACRALLFAEKHKDEDIKKATINFIKNIYFRYKNTIYWTSFRDDHPGLATEVMNCVIDSI
ncbi:hypothetical protein AVEN_50962-1 [Araneus ventricosus]|uniref:BTB domain-containing protein n=1 Tax=Araneus ventricosus TaxID=182803 RepID=A0A4Y2L8S6_ARAVE|nr:hypothetical protein AVEN_50962-1 [Araneus ventricosus]